MGLAVQSRNLNKSSEPEAKESTIGNTVDDINPAFP